MYHIKLICIKKNSIQRGFLKKSTVLLISIFLYFSLTTDFKPKGFLITLNIFRYSICMFRQRSKQRARLLMLRISFCGSSPLRNLFFYFHLLHMYTYRFDSRQECQFLPHLPPPSYVNVVFSAFKTAKLLLIPNSASSRVGLLKVHLYQILCNEAT